MLIIKRVLLSRIIELQLDDSDIELYDSSYIKENKKRLKQKKYLTNRGLYYNSPIFYYE